MAESNNLFDVDNFLDKEKLAELEKQQNPDNLPMFLSNGKKDTKANTILDKEAKKYNKLLKDIYDYEAYIKEKETAQEEESKLYETKCLPELIKLANYKLQFLHKAERFFEKGNFSKSDQQQFCVFVQIYVEEVMMISEALRDFAIKYYNLSISLMSTKQRVKFEKATATNVNTDFDNATAQEFFEENFEEFKDWEKTEEKRIFAEEKNGTDFTSISINALYKLIAKSLHPDLEQDEKIKAIKVTLMQELSAAKENKDLFAMLQVQQKGSVYLKVEVKQNIFTLERLKLFNKILHEKLSNYKRTFGSRVKNFYKDIDQMGLTYKQNSENYKIDKQVKQIKTVAKAVKKDISYINDSEDLLIYMDFYLSS